MSNASSKPTAYTLAFFSSPPHPCSYLSDRRAITLFADPRGRMDEQTYGQLTELGFRRSGPYVYRPRCGACDACIPARIPVQHFRPDRSQRRNRKANADLLVVVRNAHYREEHFLLYQRYIHARHEGGGMDVSDPKQYRDFLESRWCDTRFVEFRRGERLLAVAVVDYLPRSLSAVYTFYDPNEEKRGLGTFAVLWQIQEALRLGKPWVYLGYLIRECPKMAYKERFRPLEIFREGVWRTVNAESGTNLPPRL